MLGEKTHPIAKSYWQLAEIVRQRITKIEEIEPASSNKIGHIFGKFSR